MRCAFPSSVSIHRACPAPSVRMSTSSVRRLGYGSSFSPQAQQRALSNRQLHMGRSGWHVLILGDVYAGAEFVGVAAARAFSLLNTGLAYIVRMRSRR